MADFVRSFRDGILQVRDANNKALVLLDAEGDLSVKTARNVVETMTRGVLEEVKRGDAVPIEWSSSFKFRGVEGVPLAQSTVRTTQVGPSDTTVTLQSADLSAFSTTGDGVMGPENGASADQVAERFAWTGKSGSGLTGVTRGLDGTTAKTWAVGARVRQIDLTKRTVMEFLNRTGGYSGLLSTRSATSDVFTFTVWFAYTDVGGDVDEIVELGDAFLLNQEIQEAGDYTKVTMSGRAWSSSIEQITPP